MYFQRNNRFGRNSNNNNFRNRIKVFDPSHLISAIPEVKTESESYAAKHTFADFAISDVLKKNIVLRGYNVPTPIQDQAIPLILEGKDLIGIANTGTGKTAAFTIPLLQMISKDRTKKALVILPTRELAIQVKNELRMFAVGTGIECGLAIGGVDMRRQRQSLQRNVNVLIATPGRLKDLTERRRIDLSTFSIIVLDEVDQMVDIGFLSSIKYFISLLASERQSLFFSATVDGKVKEILNGFVRNPVTISVKKQDLLQNIKQEVIRISDKYKKIEHLHDLLNKKEFEKVLIFGRTKWGIQKLADELIHRGFRVNAIHGNKNQNQRQRALDEFKRSDIQILLATDIASRGLDIDDVTHVINFDPPDSYENYIHRIGRTGRAEKSGIALTFI